MTAYRRWSSRASSTVARGATPRWIVGLLRAGLVSMGVVFGMSTGWPGSASIEMVMLFAVFPTTAAAIAAMLTAGRRDMFASLLVPMAIAVGVHAWRRRPTSACAAWPLLWVFYSAALTVIHSTLSKTVRTAILLQKTSEDLLAEIERDQVQADGDERPARRLDRAAHPSGHARRA